MSRIYEALEFAGVAPIEEPVNEIEFSMTLPQTAAGFEEKLLGLYARIDGLIEHRGGKIVSFAGLGGSAGSTYVMEMARIGAVKLCKRVLVLATHQSGCAHRLFEGGLNRGWENITYSARSINDVVYRINEPPIAVSQLNASKESLPALLSSPRVLNTLRLMRKRYDWIFIDTPPFGRGLDAGLVSPLADGTVIVVDAGGVRWQVLRHAVTQLTAQQGNVLGVALNNRRYVIPDFVYRKL
ncbi:MAG: CpsD/CapB family tyrosine-protein kinase [Candidatus Hydrogenedentes bacterium]|nr:CpsD/CapB family tyrosine-protein kinase [Candidatus Hydrogenedentota bacterium]